MSEILRRIDRHGERYLMLVFYCFIVFVIVVEVFRRFVLGFSSLWGEEVARFAFIYLGWVGASYGIKQRAHIRFDVMLHLLPKKYHVYPYLFGELCTLIFAGFALFWSFETLGTQIQFDNLTPALRVSQAWFQAAVPLGFLMIVVRVIQSAMRDWRDMRSGKDAFAGTLLFD